MQICPALRRSDQRGPDLAQMSMQHTHLLAQFLAIARAHPRGKLLVPARCLMTQLSEEGMDLSMIVKRDRLQDQGRQTGDISG